MINKTQKKTFNIKKKKQYKIYNKYLITVGKISEVTKKIMLNAAEIPNFPTKANVVPTI